MRCEKQIEFAEPPEETACSSSASVRSDCVPTRSNEAGRPATTFLCTGCADNVSDSESWTYTMTDMETGDDYVRNVPEYDGIPVVAKDLPPFILRAFVSSDQFVQAADEALDCIRRWEVSCVKIEVEGDGVLAYTRAGEKVRVRFES